VSTLLLRLEGPMQSWGTQSRFRDRDTGREPSKSGVIGLLCAALGRARSAPLGDLATLRMGVRVDREGTVSMDYHTSGAASPNDDLYGEKERAIISQRHYLADASFLVGLEGEDRLLRELLAALQWPRWQIYLGRKAFLPSKSLLLSDEPPVGPGLREEPLEMSLRTWPWMPDGSWRRDPPARLRLVLDAAPGSTMEIRNDVPISFEDRLFSLRNVTTKWVEVPR